MKCTAITTPDLFLVLARQVRLIADVLPHPISNCIFGATKL
jgi:hypothetical protein